MPMSSVPTAPTMKSSTKCTRTRTSHRASIISCAIGNTPTTACALTSHSLTSPHWNSSPVGKTTHERQSVTNLLDEYTGFTGCGKNGLLSQTFGAFAILSRHLLAFFSMPTAPPAPADSSQALPISLIALSPSPEPTLPCELSYKPLPRTGKSSRLFVVLEISFAAATPLFSATRTPSPPASVFSD